MDQSAAATPSPFTLIPDLQTVPKKAPAPTAPVAATPTTNGKRTADEAGLPSRTSTKRSAQDADLDVEQSTKRGKVADENGAETITIDDDGAILLD
jgi:ubiquitin-like 1-activating enzyme E1 B